MKMPSVSDIIKGQKGWSFAAFLMPKSKEVPMSKTKIINSAGITAAIGLAALPVFLTLSPMFGTSEANAEPSTIGAAATVVPNLSLSAQNVSMVMTPTGSGTVFKTASVDAMVSTNNETGYTLYFSDKDNNTSLKHANLADQAINSVETPATGTSMLPNTWGYTLQEPAAEAAEDINNATNLGLTYSSIPTDYTTIKTRDTQTTPSETSKLTFGVKIDNSIPSGTYSDEILISAVINYSSAGYDQNQLWLDKNGTRITTMQEMTPAICASVPTPTVTATGSNAPTITLTDTRDSKTYTVKKLADGNCWMTDDLKIAGETLTPANSNVNTEVTLPAADTYANLKTSSYEAAQIANDGLGDAYLYNWYAATAATSDVRNITSNNAPQDICPRGWHLPDDNNNGSWSKLLRQGQGGYEIATSGNNYSSTTTSWGTGAKFTVADQNPLNMHLTGRFYDGLLEYTSYGSYWSRTVRSDTNAYNLFFDNSSIYPHNDSDKRGGRAVRCVANDQIDYMQGWTGCSGLPENKTVFLYDKRDDKGYPVTKIGSKCWTTKNLALGGDKEITLTPSDTDISSNFTLPASSSNFNSLTEARVFVDSTYGGFYNWYAATAGDDTYPSHAGIATNSICPRGWHLPPHFEFGDITGYKDAFNPIQAGYYHGNAPSNRGNVGAYWSSTVKDATHAYILLYTGSNMVASYDDDSQSGLSVRCVFGPNPAP